MHRNPSQTTDDIDRPHSGTLKENYSLHDIAQDRVVTMLTEAGYDVELWGIDMRDDDGEDGLIYDNKMDLRVWTTEGETGEVYESIDSDGRSLVGITEVKSKRSPSWFGVFNLRHYGHYVEWVHSTDVPVFIYMTYLEERETAVEDDSTSVGYEVSKEGFLPLEPFVEYREAQQKDNWDAKEDVLHDPPIEADQVDSVYQAPDGQPVVSFNDERFTNRDVFLDTLRLAEVDV